jgi:hypothetical protein
LLPVVTPLSIIQESESRDMDLAGSSKDKENAKNMRRRAI